MSPYIPIVKTRGFTAKLGKFIGSERHISKRGSSTLQEIEYETMRCIKSHRRPASDPAVYDYLIKKESEGKTVVIVSHRDSTFEFADKIYKLESWRLS